MSNYGMNVTRIANSGTSYTNDVFIKIKEFIGVEAVAITNATTLTSYESGSFSANDTLLKNPLTSDGLTGEDNIPLFTENGQYRFSANKKWILFRESETKYILYYNTFYSPDFADYARDETTQAKKYFVRYCNLVNYDDTNCFCVEPPDNETYDFNPCLNYIGLDASKLTSQELAQYKNACACLASHCGDARINSPIAPIFQKNCNLTFCDIDLNMDRVAISGDMVISQECGTDITEATGVEGTTGEEVVGEEVVGEEVVGEEVVGEEVVGEEVVDEEVVDEEVVDEEVVDDEVVDEEPLPTPTQPSVWRKFLDWLGNLFGIEFYINEKNNEHIYFCIILIILLYIIFL
jgi:hypothetical protein